MQVGNDRNNRLSSWKEIAVYLDCDIRTCHRWEKNLGMPVHRMEGTSKSRIFAFKNELDDWLYKRLNNGIPNEKRVKGLSHYKRVAIGVFCILAVSAGVYFIILKKPTESSTSPPPSPSEKTASGVPQSTGPLTLEDGDIVSTEYSSEGRLRIWRKEGPDSYRETWRMEPLRHASLAIGDLDGNGDFEIAAPGVCREQEKVGERVVHKWRFFLNIYKPGRKDWWKTTFYSKPNCLYEDTFLFYTETKIGDVDARPGNEVVFITKHSLGVFKYMKEEDEFKLLRSRYSFMEGVDLLLKSVAVRNIDDDPLEEIIIAADEWRDESTPDNKGWIIIFKVAEGWPEIVKAIPVDANLAFQALRLGDIIQGGSLEILCPGYRHSSDIWNTFILGWDADGQKVIDRKVYEKGDIQNKLIHLDAGDLSSDPGDEVVVGLHDPDKLVCYAWNGNNLIEIYPRHTLDDRISLLNVYINEAASKRDSLGEVVAWGGSLIEDEPGRFYLEVFDFNDGFISKWQRMGGEKGELRVSYAGFGRSQAR